MKKSRPQYQQSSPSHGNSSSPLHAWFRNEYMVGLLTPVALVILYSLVEVLK